MATPPVGRKGRLMLGGSMPYVSLLKWMVEGSVVCSSLAAVFTAGGLQGVAGAAQGGSLRGRHKAWDLCLSLAAVFTAGGLQGVAHGGVMHSEDCAGPGS